MGRARTLAVPDSGMAEGCSTSSALSANKWDRITSPLAGSHKKRSSASTGFQRGRPESAAGVQQPRIDPRRWDEWILVIVRARPTVIT